jgi:hypothetical protein
LAVVADVENVKYAGSLDRNDVATFWLELATTLLVPIRFARRKSSTLALRDDSILTETNS